MILPATLNGSRSFDASGGSLTVEADERLQHIVLSFARADEIVWRSEPLPLSPEPSRARSSSAVCDFLAIAWPAAGAVVVLGYPRAIIVDLETGRARATFLLEFTGKESLEQVGLSLFDDGRHLLITSTKRLWVVDPSLEPVLRYEPRFMFAGLPRAGASEVVVDEYDFDDDSEIVTQVLRL